MSPPLLDSLKPTVIVCDIEGGEDGLFDATDLSSVRHIVIELHPKSYGEEGAARVLSVLAARGLVPEDGLAQKRGGVVVLSRS